MKTHSILLVLALIVCCSCSTSREIKQYAATEKFPPSQSKEYARVYKELKPLQRPQVRFIKYSQSNILSICINGRYYVPLSHGKESYSTDKNIYRTAGSG
ncbi:hypothetical protein [uncultured Bacteroides sp.]|uniref:hypothetical protein n=1 Tax=uncultured Bacteroides sp. TaxID=162156 RepID=UPI00261C0888|nr:hypothetical protein [uncultured Bacteroides sp.]